MSDYRNFTITRHGRDPLNWSWTIVDCKGRSYNGFFHSQAEAEKFIDDYSDGLTNTSKFDWSY
jgi:hypothetical protein